MTCNRFATYTDIMRCAPARNAWRGRLGRNVREEVANVNRRIRLRGINGVIEDQLWEAESTLRVGRMDTQEIIIDDCSVSRRHAEVRPTPDGFALVDLGSTNGCKVNGVPTTHRDLRDGDELTVGRTRILFQAS